MNPSITGIMEDKDIVANCRSRTCREPAVEEGWKAIGQKRVNVPALRCCNVPIEGEVKENAWANLEWLDGSQQETLESCLHPIEFVTGSVYSSYWRRFSFPQSENLPWLRLAGVRIIAVAHAANARKLSLECWTKWNVEMQ